MTEILKKTINSAADTYLGMAAKQGIQLSWDRYAAQQPQCGFGRLAICCHDCQEGPCRLNPFSKEVELTVCGLDRHQLVAAEIYGQVADAAAGIGEQAPSKASLRGKSAQELMNKAMSLAISGYGRMTKTGNLELFGQAKSKVEVNFGTITRDSVHILVAGRWSESTLMALVQAAADASEAAVAVGASTGVRILTDSISGVVPGTSIVSDRSELELAVISGAIELLAWSPACALPALKTLASRYHTLVVEDQPASGVECWAQAVVAKAIANFARRERSNTLLVEESRQVQVGYPSRDVVRQWAEALRNGSKKGVVLLAGCSGVKESRGRQIVGVAKDLYEDHIVLATGCAGTVLAQEGLVGETKVQWLGGCPQTHTAISSLLNLAEELGEQLANLPILIAFPESSQKGALLQALAAMALGFTVYWGGHQVWWGSQEVLSYLTSELPHVMGGRLVTQPEKGRPYETAAMLKEVLQQGREEGCLSTPANVQGAESASGTAI